MPRGWWNERVDPILTEASSVVDGEAGRVSGGISWESHEIEDASLAGSLSADEFQNSPLESSSSVSSFEFLDCDTQVEGYVQSVPDVIGLLGEAAELPAQVALVASILRGNKRRGGTQGKVEGVRKEFWKERGVRSE